MDASEERPRHDVRADQRRADVGRPKRQAEQPASAGEQAALPGDLAGELQEDAGPRAGHLRLHAAERLV